MAPASCISPVAVRMSLLLDAIRFLLEQVSGGSVVGGVWCLEHGSRIQPQGNLSPPMRQTEVAASSGELEEAVNR